MIDCVVLLLLACLLAFDKRGQAGAQQARNKPAGLRRLSVVRVICFLALLLGPSICYALALEAFLDERGLHFFFDSLRPSATSEFFLSTGYLYGLATLIGGFLARRFLSLPRTRES